MREKVKKCVRETYLELEKFWMKKNHQYMGEINILMKM